MRLRVILVGVFLLCFLHSMVVYGEDTQVCTDCHGDKEIMKSMGRPGARSLYYVNQAELKDSVHGTLGCSACHQDISMEDHPEKGSKAGRTRSSSCKNCHTAFQGIHAALTGGKTGNYACTDCHGAHAVKSVKFIQSSDYCFNCHGKTIHLPLGDGSRLSLKVDQNHFSSSVHHMLTCSDCHFGFSAKAHPLREFESKRAYTVASSEACRRCHFKEYTDTLESVHNTVAGGGPVCSDCHGAHEIVASSLLKAKNPMLCAKCHQSTQDAFAKSVHGAARITGNQDTPTCLTCHGAHAISNPKGTAFYLLVPEMCGKCHSDEKRVGKYGISSTVVKTYNQNFHGITLGFYKQKGGTKHPAVCTDCHGIHDIAGMTQPNSPKDKAYLEHKCMRCHPNASAGFSDSIIPHYQASFAMAPSVFAINHFYKLFIGLMVIGLFVQILLHIWRIIFKVNEEENRHGN